MTTTTTVYSPTTTLPSVKTGMLVIALKDEQHNIPGGTTILNLTLRIDGITAHYVETTEGYNETGNETGKWITVSTEPKTLDLLQYTDVLAIVGEKELDAGKYTQLRLNITEANITIKNSFFYIYTSKTYQMEIPSEELKLINQFTVDSARTTVLTLDFDVENSVTHTADGYLLKPVVKMTEEKMEHEKRPSNSTIV